MNKEKEIKDICKLICATCAQFDGCAINCKAHRDTAEALYNAGYRKTLPNTELFTQNMKNVLEIEKKQAVKEFVEKLKEYINEYEEIESRATYKDITTYRCKFAKNTETKDATWARHKGFLSGLLTAISKIDELLKEYEK